MGWDAWMDGGVHEVRWLDGWMDGWPEGWMSDWLAGWRGGVQAKT